MTNNDCLRRLRYILDIDDAAMVAVVSLGGRLVSGEEMASMLEKDDADNFTECADDCFAAFLNGLIIEKRGVNEGVSPPMEEKLTNNVIFRKLRIAFDLKADDILIILSLADCQISKHELSAFFRKPASRQFRECKDQVLRKFLGGLQIKQIGVEST